jgi:hypothetical protein
MNVSRRKIVLTSTAFAAFPQMGHAAIPREITWDDLIPDGIPYGEIISEGERDEQQDTWRPIFDENASKLNDAFKDAYIKIPAYMIPIDQSLKGVTSFIMVPYVGACIHTPPPPPNQLIYGEISPAWKQDNLWDAVWVTGRISHEAQSTDVADTGYTLKADKIEIYEW